MADLSLPDEWIQVWFTDKGTACIHDTAENRTLLDKAIETAGGGIVDLLCIDGAPFKVRRNYIAGYIRSAPAQREIERAFEKKAKAEKGPDWEGADDDD